MSNLDRDLGELAAKTEHNMKNIDGLYLFLKNLDNKIEGLQKNIDDKIDGFQKSSNSRIDRLLFWIMTSMVMTIVLLAKGYL